MPDQNENLLADLQNSIMDMQNQMQNTYRNLADFQVTGESFDKTVKITMTATYTFVDIDFNEKALQGGIKEFKKRLGEAWADVVKKIQETTQSKTIELLQSMQIPDEIKNMSMPGIEKKEEE